MALPTATWTAGNADLYLRRETLARKLCIHDACKFDGILVTVPAHVCAKARLDEFYARDGLGFCESAQCMDDLLHIRWFESCKDDSLA